MGEETANAQATINLVRILPDDQQNRALLEAFKKAPDSVAGLFMDNPKFAIEKLKTKEFQDKEKEIFSSMLAVANGSLRGVGAINEILSGLERRGDILSKLSPQETSRLLAGMNDEEAKELWNNPKLRQNTE
jgi:hypothetical protein